MRYSVWNTACTVRWTTAADAQVGGEQCLYCSFADCCRCAVYNSDYKLPIPWCVSLHCVSTNWRAIYTTIYRIQSCSTSVVVHSDFHTCYRYEPIVNEWWDMQSSRHRLLGHSGHNSCRCCYRFAETWLAHPNFHCSVALPTETGKKGTFQPSRRKTIHVVMILMSNRYVKHESVFLVAKGT
jgi:hypothetical protein